MYLYFEWWPRFLREETIEAPWLLLFRTITCTSSCCRYASFFCTLHPRPNITAIIWTTKSCWLYKTYYVQCTYISRQRRSSAAIREYFLVLSPRQVTDAWLKKKKHQYGNGNDSNDLIYYTRTMGTTADAVTSAITGEHVKTITTT